MLTPPFANRCLCCAGCPRYLANSLWQTHCHRENRHPATASPIAPFFGMADGTCNGTGARTESFRSSPGTGRAFRPTCGTPMAYHTRISGERHVQAGTLDDRTAFTRTSHGRADQQLPRLHIDDGLPRT